MCRHEVPGVVVRPHFIHVLGEIVNGLIHTYIHKLYFLSNFRVACNTINISS